MIKRIDRVLVTLVQTTYNDRGQPVDEELSQPIPVFLAKDELLQSWVVAQYAPADHAPDQRPS